LDGVCIILTVAVGKGEWGFGVVEEGITGKNYIIGENADAAGTV
jgi:hypothetical protein